MFIPLWLLILAGLIFVGALISRHLLSSEIERVQLFLDEKGLLDESREWIP